MEAIMFETEMPKLNDLADIDGVIDKAIEEKLLERRYGPQEHSHVFDDDASFVEELSIFDSPTNSTEAATEPQVTALRSASSLAESLNYSKPLKDVVESEIEVIKRLEMGPSEAELRRRKLTEIDEEVMEQRIRQLKRLARNQLTKAVGATDLKENRRKLTACKKWILAQRRAAESAESSEIGELVLEWIRDELQRSQERLVLLDESPVNFEAYLRAPDSDGEVHSGDEEETDDGTDCDEAEEEEQVSSPSPRSSGAASAGAQKLITEEVEDSPETSADVIFSDSENDDDDEEISDKRRQQQPVENEMENPSVLPLSVVADDTPPCASSALLAHIMADASKACWEDSGDFLQDEGDAYGLVDNQRSSKGLRAIFELDAAGVHGLLACCSSRLDVEVKLGADILADLNRTQTDVHCCPKDRDDLWKKYLAYHLGELFNQIKERILVASWSLKDVSNYAVNRVTSLESEGVAGSEDVRAATALGDNIRGRHGKVVEAQLREAEQLLELICRWYTRKFGKEPIEFSADLLEDAAECLAHPNGYPRPCTVVGHVGDIDDEEKEARRVHYENFLAEERAKRARLAQQMQYAAEQRQWQQKRLQAIRQQVRVQMAKKPLDKRTALKQSLMRNVLVVAKDNLCRQMRILPEQLQLKSEIVEKCRLLLDLLRDREERRRRRAIRNEEKQREIRRLRYLQQMEEEDDDEGEFDEREFNALGGEGEMSEQRKREILRDFENWPDEIAPEDEEEGDDDAEEDDNSEALVAALAGSDAEDSEPDDSDNEEGEFEKAKVDVGGEGEGDDDEDEADTIPVKHPAGMKSRRVVVFNDDREPSAPHALQVTGGNGGDPLQAYADAADGRQEPVVLESESMHVAEAGAAEASGAPIVKKSKVDRNAQYRRMLEEEERRYSKGGSQALSSLLEEEAEEEEEEGLQAGLGDFGFGVSKKGEESENDALRLKKGDFDNIVDELSDGEGDEEAGNRARMDQAMREDREQTKAVITAVTEGHSTLRRGGRKTRYTHDKLISGRDELELTRKRGEGEQVGEDEDGDEEDLDEEELLMRGLQSKMDRQKDSAPAIYGSDDSDISEDEDFEAGSDVDDDEAFDAMDEEAQKRELARRTERRERAKLEAIRRRQFAIQTKQRRHLRRQASQSQSQSQRLGGVGGDTGPSSELASQAAEDLLLPAPLALSLDDDDLPVPGLLLNSTGSNRPTESANVTMSEAQERRNQRKPLAPKQYRPEQSVPGARGLHRSQTVGTGRDFNPNSLLGSAKTRSVGPVIASSLYGSLNQAELDAGYGMGMAITGAAVHRSDATKGSGLFSAVTGIKRPAAEPSSSAGRRSFVGASGMARRRGTGSSSIQVGGGHAVSVAAQQFVFVGHSNNSQHYSSASNLGTGFGEATLSSHSQIMHAESSLGFGAAKENRGNASRLGSSIASSSSSGTLSLSTALSGLLSKRGGAAISSLSTGTTRTETSLKRSKSTL